MYILNQVVEIHVVAFSDFRKNVIDRYCLKLFTPVSDKH